MDQVSNPLLGKSVLVFFDDILVYWRTLEDHWRHLEDVFALMEKNQMYIKTSKCTFATNRFEYLSHFISNKGVKTEPKVAAIASSSTPTSIKDLLNFLGLALISKPLKKELSSG